jgi:hypothetical protein
LKNRSKKQRGSMQYKIFLFTFILGLFACEDENKTSTGVGANQAGIIAGAGTPAASQAGTQVIGGTMTAGTNVLPAGTTPTTDMQIPDQEIVSATCESDNDCGPGKICYQGQCITQQRCDAQNCPDGQICVAGLCFEQNQPPVDEEIGSLAFEPADLPYSFAMPQQVVSQTADLVNTGTTALTLSRLELTGSTTFVVLTNLQFPLRMEPNDRVAIEIAYTSDDTAPDSASLRALTQEGAEQSLRLFSTIKVVGGNTPCLEIQPTSMNFGSVSRGNTATRSFIMSACSNVPVQVNVIRNPVTWINTPLQQFQIVRPMLPMVLMPGMTQVVDVIYTPLRAGIDTGYFEVASSDSNQPVQRVNVTGIAVQPELQDVEFHIKLRWDTDLTDVDLHLIAPNGQMWSCNGDCYFSNGNPDWGTQGQFLDDPFLDVDDVNGYGPENINLSAPIPGTYTILVHYYDDHDGRVPNATIEIINFGNVVRSFGPTQLNNVNDVWYVAEVTFPGLVITPLGPVQLESRGGDICF